MSYATTGRPAICLNMIVKNEAHIIEQTLDMVAPLISTWVIVDTGSDDGTQDVIRNHMARLGIPGELHERPWQNFGHNRSEALDLARGHGDYIWVLDADDAVVGTLDFGELGKDLYQLRFGQFSDVFWRPNLFRNGLAVSYSGVVHECVMVAEEFTYDRLEGDYYIDSRRLGARNLDPQKYARDRDLLLVEVERNPNDERSVFYLAQSYYDLGDFENAREWYQRRADMGGWAEEAYYSMFRVAESMSALRKPWPEVQDAYLRAWEFRPGRAEPLHAIAFRYRLDERYWLAYLFAKRAAEIPYPDEDTLYVSADIYRFSALDEQALCASWIDKHDEAFDIWRRVLAGPHLVDADRQRIAENRDICATTLLEVTPDYPEQLARSLARSLASGHRDGDVVVSLIAGPDRDETELTLNSLLHTCTDLSRVRRFLVVNAGLSAADRATLVDRYGFVEFCDSAPGESVGARLARISRLVDGRFWLHLGQGWRFFATEALITRLTGVLAAEAEVFQVGVNFADAVKLTRSSAADSVVRRAPGAGRYALSEQAAHGPAMFDMSRLARVGGVRDTDPDPIGDLGRRAAAAGLQPASLDEVLCVSAV